MTFIDVAWANGDVGTEVKFDQMVANGTHNRVEADFKLLISGNITRTGTTEADSEVSVSIGTTAIGTYTTSGAKTLMDHDISGYTDGLLTFVFDLDGVEKTFHFVKTPDMKYLSMWLNVVASSNSPYTVGAEQCTIIAHKDTQGWT